MVAKSQLKIENIDFCSRNSQIYCSNNNNVFGGLTKMRGSRIKWRHGRSERGVMNFIDLSIIKTIYRMFVTSFMEDPLAHSGEMER